MSSSHEPYWTIADGYATHTGTGRQIKLMQPGLLTQLPEDAMPARPRGDQKERTFNLLIRDGVNERLSIKEKKLIGDAPGGAGGTFVRDERIPEELRDVFGAILDDHYVIEGIKVRFLFPFHVALPAMYEFHGRYKMFNGKILAFLSQPNDGEATFNTALIQRFYNLFNEQQDLNLLDKELLVLARNTAESDAIYEASATTLITRHYGEEMQVPGALLPLAHERFQRDLETILTIPRLNRRDKITSAINVFYVHLALYFQRLAWLLDEELAHVVAALTDRTVPLDRASGCFGGDWGSSPFAGSILFRVGTGRTMPVKLTDGAVTSYREQNRRQLLMPANLSVLGAAREVMAACGIDSSGATFVDLADAARANPATGAAFEEGLNGMATATVEALSGQDRADIERQIEAGAPGLSNLREALLKVGRTALRRHGRDIVHGLVLRGGRGYISRRGRSLFFFEVGQDLLLLLAKLIVRDSQVPFRRFVEELRCYGFEPQSRAELDQLAETLRALNLLEKHSDAGEAMYVKHFL